MNNQSTILILTSFLKSYTGSEIVVLDLAKTFQHLGFKVSVASFVIGSPLKEKFQESGIEVQNIFYLPQNTSYDIIWSQHFTTLPYCLNEKKITAQKIIFSSLSAFHPIEQPPTLTNQISLFVANSLETKNNLITNYEIPGDYIKVLPNPVTESFFKYQKELNSHLQKIAVVSNHVPAELHEAVATLKRIDISVDIYGEGFKHELITPEILINYDAIITIGKTVQYGLALGLPVYLYDIHGGEGWINHNNIQLASEYNFSGRSLPLKKTPQEIVQGLLSYKKENFAFYRDFAKQQYSLSNYLTEIISSEYPPLLLSPKTLELLATHQQFYYAYTQSNNDFAQLFFSKDNTFDENNSSKAVIVKNSLNTISFVPNKENKFFRLELTNQIAIISQLKIDLIIDGKTHPFDISKATLDSLLELPDNKYLNYTSDSKIFFTLDTPIDRIDISFYIDDYTETKALITEFIKTQAAQAEAYSLALNNLNIAEKERSQLLEDIKHKDSQLLHLREEFQRKEDLLLQLREESQHVQQLLHNTEQQLSSALNSFNIIQNSTSWKATYPIRWTLDHVKHFLRKVKNVHQKVKVFGGYSLATHKFIQKIKELGIKKALQEAFFILKSTPLQTIPPIAMATIVEPTVSTPSNFDITNRIAYQEWIKYNDTLTPSDIHRIKKTIQQFTTLPKISVLMPVYNVDIKWLKEAIESVQNQLYSNWELCISDDNSPNEDIRTVLRQYTESDSRIKVIFRERNGHISENSNSALTLVTGEWVALMDHDDLLPAHALYEVVKVINENPTVNLIYSDEDKIDENNQRFMPHFKADFNLDLLYSQNYISHLGVYKSDIAKQIGGFRKGVEGSQDFDFLLRYILVSGTENVMHIPKILYHWRAIEGSTALAAGEKSYTTEAGIKALKNYFHQLNEDVEVSQGKVSNTYRVKWNLPHTPLVSLIIPTKNGYAITKQAIDSILEKTTYQNYEIILVDNNSDDAQALAYFNQIAQHPKVQLLRYPYPFNYSAINNFAVQHVKGEIIGLINNDIEVINEDWLTEMVSQAMRKDIGCVGAMLYYPNDLIQHAGVVIGIGGVAGHSHKMFPKGHHGYFSRLFLIQNYSAVTAACLLVRKEVFEEVGGLNENDLTVAFNDVDLCLKVHTAGYRNLWTPYAELYHHESISRGAEDSPEKIARFERETHYMIKTWHTNQFKDSAYNPNLSDTHEDFSIAMHSRV